MPTDPKLVQIMNNETLIENSKRRLEVNLKPLYVGSACLFNDIMCFNFTDKNMTMIYSVANSTFAKMTISLNPTINEKILTAKLMKLGNQNAMVVSFNTMITP